MSTTHKALADRMEADLRLTSTGVLSPRNTSQDAEWEAEWTRASQEAIRTGLPTRWVFSASSPQEPAQT